jgi:2,5-diketo-D-gluconate reductase A
LERHRERTRRRPEDHMPDLAPTLKLEHGAEIPQLGIGTWPMNDRETERALEAAFELGYRLVDTAENYRNEVGVGRAIAASGLPRDEVFVTTKFNKRWHSVDGARQAFEASAERLGLDAIDLLLIHWPNPAQDRYVDAWRGLATLLDEGRVRAIGTSNFKPSHLQRLLDETGVIPDVNQIQLSPRVARTSVRDFDAEHGIVTESWSPLGKGGDLLRTDAVVQIAQAHERTPGQIVLRWHVQHGLVAIPKSSRPDRMAENFAVFDFELTADEMSALDELDRGERSATDSDSFGH